MLFEWKSGRIFSPPKRCQFCSSYWNFITQFHSSPNGRMNSFASHSFHLNFFSGTCQKPRQVVLFVMILDCVMWVLSD